MLDGLSSEEHKWGKQSPTENVLDGLKSEAYVWKKQPHDDTNVLDALPNDKV